MFDLKYPLVMAICKVESNFDPWATRHEPHWKYHLTTNKFAKELHISNQTEKVLQEISWGPMQVMGTVARELGYTDHLTKLCILTNGIHYGCKKLNSLFEKYEYRNDVIAAYNAGSPRKSGDLYVNQSYVDKVLEAMNDYK
jgi:hypothetical protein